MKALRVIGWGLDFMRLVALIAVLVVLGVNKGPLVAGALLAGLFMFELIIRQPRVVRQLVFPLALLAFFAGLFITGDAEAKLNFYTVTAQVVPALFIALAVQVQAFMRGVPPGEARRAAVLTVYALLLAEFECLDVIVHGDASRGDLDIVIGALAAAAVGLALPTVLGPEDASPTTEPERDAPELSWKGLVGWALLLFASRKRN